MSVQKNQFFWGLGLIRAGKSMPDASLMLELCEILDITVNELLSGERIAMEDYKKKAEDIVLKNKGNQNAGSCVSVLCITVMWAIYGIFRKYHQRIFLSLGFSLLLLIFVPIIIIRVTDYFLPQYEIVSKSDVFNGIITFAIALICFGIDYLTQHKKENFK